MAFLTFITFLAVLARYTTALQVTPNSPCASFCVDSNGLDVSDPNSSTTTNDDITCYDSEYATSAAGQKFQQCMSCLQDSTFSQGSESDQLWFLYNLRYTFDVCVFGYPNATGIASTPCSTSTACGDLESPLTGDGLEVTYPDYSYCAVDGGAMTGPVIPKCRSCVAASDDQDFLANYLVALEAGCQQQPAPGVVIGLNDTIFSKTLIEAVDPSSLEEDEDSAPVLTTTQAAGVAIGAVIVILVIAGLWFVRHRKQRNRRLQIEGNMPAIPRSRFHRPASSLSFRCQTHLSPRSPAFFPNPSNSTIEEEKAYASPDLTLGIHTASPASRPVPWRTASSSSTTTSTTLGGASNAKPFSRPENAGGGLPLHTLATAIPSLPSNVYSPKSSSPFSPVDDLTTPQSTTSTRSTAQLLPLRAYNPADYGVTSTTPQLVSPSSGSTSSPLLSRAWEQQQQQLQQQQQQKQQQRSGPGGWDQLPPRGSSRVPGPAGVGIVTHGAMEKMGMAVGAKGRRVSSNTGSPVESRQIDTRFAGPPGRR
ncbi:hypothetical protein F4778DRAFT_7314 [Xylariomycetidae sp. FL2044]|nr:hypothetical protein F4778DRAFT_7314 [Xylariomycetidae sp. FL2044]